jgi:hypothetical protein
MMSGLGERVALGSSALINAILLATCVAILLLIYRRQTRLSEINRKCATDLALIEARLELVEKILEVTLAQQTSGDDYAGRDEISLRSPSRKPARTMN